MKVLIADDSLVVRQRLIEMLNEFHTIEEIYQSNNVLETIHSFQSIHPDVLILDIRMPGGNGIDVLKKIQKENIKTIVIVLTNYPYPQYEKICLGLGASYFFDKSNEYENIIKVFQKLSYENRNENK